MRIGLDVGIEAGLLSLEDARAFVRSGLADRCVRVLVEPLDNHPAAAIAHAAAMGDVLSTAGMVLAQIHHGDGLTRWAVSARAVSRGHSVRTGLADLLPAMRRLYTSLARCFNIMDTHVRFLDCDGFDAIDRNLNLD